MFGGGIGGFGEGVNGNAAWEADADEFQFDIDLTVPLVEAKTIGNINRAGQGAVFAPAPGDRLHARLIIPLRHHDAQVGAVFTDRLLFQNADIRSPKDGVGVTDAAGVEPVDLLIEIEGEVAQVGLGIDFNQGSQVLGLQVHVGEDSQARSHFR
jgi:hypothetical protein